MSTLERKWWFVGPISGVAVWLSFQLIVQAGMVIATLSISQWLVCCLCFFGIQRALSFAGWLIFLVVAPDLAKKGV
jgi:hypothetical protein